MLLGLATAGATPTAVTPVTLTRMLLGLATAGATPSACHGYGARFEARMLHLPAGRSRHLDRSPQATAYATFSDTALRSWASSFKDGAHKLVRTAFESEAEHWVDTAFTSSTTAVVPPAHAASKSNITTNISLSNATTAVVSTTTTPVALVVGSALSCLVRIYHLLLSRFDARPPSFVTVPTHNATGNGVAVVADEPHWDGLVLLSGGDRNAALAERLVANHAEFARRHGYAHWWHRGSMVAESGWLPY